MFTFLTMSMPQLVIVSVKGALQLEYNILSLIEQLYPGMEYMNTKKINN